MVVALEGREVVGDWVNEPMRIVENRLFGITLETVGRFDDLVRVEVGSDELSKMFDSEKLQRLDLAAKDAGFIYVTLDLQGYRTGAMDEGLST